MGIRDSWDAPKCPLKEAINALSGIIGTPVETIVDWGMLWSVMSPQFPDPSTFIPSIEEATRVWAECLQERLESEELEEWTDEFVDKVKQGSGIRLEIGITENGVGRPENVFDQSTGQLKILFPKGASEKVYRNTLQAGFAGDLEHLFNKKSAITTASTKTLPIGARPPVEEGWSVIPPPSSAAAPSSAARGVMPQAEPAPERFPTLSMLARPEVLFETETPYLIYVRKFGNKELHIEGSHHASLTLLCDYFQKWVRKDRNYNGNVLDIEKQNSLFGLNTGFDYVKITCNRWELLNPTPFLAFIEIVLKYKLIEASSGVTWFYRRDTKFI
ncbi:hypothetical protein H072_4136 [Dactylellina haptotyla CBS 200.50]|uniref:Uncharacterized protein n=1 Tax=Dactylellina haptotyla (strain CBS 200.50) TaxID=1284197 RepID=S8AFU1_DACHA|nr:hypothetical protein H072_4136 [Dactylellina haptotyla CBS 200.50]